MGRKRKLYKKMRHIHLRFLDNKVDCDLSEPLAWLLLSLEDGEALDSQLVPTLEHLAATCEPECRPDVERLLEKAIELISAQG